MLGKATILCCCITFLFPARRDLALAADGPASYSREDIAKYAPALTLQLRSANASDRQNALEIIHKVADTSSRILSDNLPAWTDPLIENENYDDVLNLTMIAISDRSFDTTTVEKLQEARVRALIGQQKLDEALVAAKSYYCTCVLSSTPYAIDLLSNILERQGRSPVASRLRFEQTRTPTTQPTAPLAPVLGGEGQGEGSNFENGLPLSGTVLTSIKIDPLIWQDAMDHAGGHSYNNAMSRGNIDLEMDKPDDARKEFELAVELSDGASSSKNMREAVEGIARAIRAKEGATESANAFIRSMRQESPTLLGKIKPEKLREIAKLITLAPVWEMSVPAIEEERAKQERDHSRSLRQIKVVTGFESASPLRFRSLSATHFKIALVPQIRTLCDWFCFRVDGANGQTIRIDVTTDTASIEKWWTLNPMWCDASNFEKPDVLSQINSPKDELSLLPKTDDQAWHYIADAWRSDAQTLSFSFRFPSDSVYVAMRVPYTPLQNGDHLRKLVSSNKSVELLEIGQSRQKRPLLMAKIGEGGTKLKPCLLMYAGEHPDEPDGMWAALGAIEFLSSDSDEAKNLRSKCIFLIIPQLDPDSSAGAAHEGINATFLADVRSVESIAYSNWFQRWVNANNRLDLVIDLHNMQSSEMGHVQCWLMEGVGERGELANLVHRSIIQGIQSNGFEMAGTPVQRGWSPDRLGGWLSRRYGSLCFLYELNSQAPLRHLTLRDIKKIGSTLAKSAAEFLVSSDGTKLTANVDAHRQDRLARWASHNDLANDLDAISAEAVVSKGVGRDAAENNKDNAQIERWVP